jgi:fructokinase
LVTRQSSHGHWGRCDNGGVHDVPHPSPRPEGPLVVVAGEALIDLIVRADGEIAPVAGGSPYNSVRAIARLGVPAAWVGGLSSDRFGRLLEAGLTADGVACDLVQRTDLPTTLALAEVAADGSASYHFYVDSTSAPTVLPEPLAGGLPASTRAFLTGSLGLVLEPMAATLEGVALGVPADRLVMLDPNARPSITRDADAWRARMARIIARADIVKASTEDLEYLRPGDSSDAAAAWVRANGPSVVLVTDGSRPVRVLAGQGIELVAAPPVDVVDTVGAGDTFGGAFLACLVHDGVHPGDLVDPAIAVRAARFAVRASAAVCARAGANPPTLAELGGWPPA